MDAKQFAWLYLIENGNAGAEPSFYGGVDIIDKRLQKAPYNDWMKGYESYEKRREFYLKELKTYGVDWVKSKSPESDNISQFTDTFHDPTYKEFLVGTLVLKNGTNQHWCAEAIEVTNVFEMMAQIDGAKERFAAIFGE